MRLLSSEDDAFLSQKRKSRKRQQRNTYVDCRTIGQGWNELLETLKGNEITTEWPQKSELENTKKYLQPTCTPIANQAWCKSQFRACANSPFDRDHFISFDKHVANFPVENYNFNQSID